MTEVPDGVARVGLAAWLAQREHGLDEPSVLGMIGDEYCLVEVEDRNRERVIAQLIDDYQDGSLRVEIAFFGNAGSVFAAPVDLLALWPKSAADLPVEILIHNYQMAALSLVQDEVVVSVRHARRPSAGPPRRQFRLGARQYEDAISLLERESRRLRDDLLAVAQKQAPRKVSALRQAFENWPA